MHVRVSIQTLQGVLGPPRFVDRGGPNDTFATHAVCCMVLLIYAIMTAHNSSAHSTIRNRMLVRQSQNAFIKAVTRRRYGCCFLKPPKGSVQANPSQKCQATHVLI